jgi:tetratricopeptide (TPR) repeat protein
MFTQAVSKKTIVLSPVELSPSNVPNPTIPFAPPGVPDALSSVSPARPGSKRTQNAKFKTQRAPTRANEDHKKFFRQACDHLLDNKSSLDLNAIGINLGRYCKVLGPAKQNALGSILNLRVTLLPREGAYAPVCEIFVGDLLECLREEAGSVGGSRAADVQRGAVSNGVERDIDIAVDYRQGDIRSKFEQRFALLVQTRDPQLQTLSPEDLVRDTKLCTAICKTFIYEDQSIPGGFSVRFNSTHPHVDVVVRLAGTAECSPYDGILAAFRVWQTTEGEYVDFPVPLAVQAFLQKYHCNWFITDIQNGPERVHKSRTKNLTAGVEFFLLQPDLLKQFDKTSYEEWQKFFKWHVSPDEADRLASDPFGEEGMRILGAYKPLPLAQLIEMYRDLLGRPEFAPGEMACVLFLAAITRYHLRADVTSQPAIHQRQQELLQQIVDAMRGEFGKEQRLALCKTIDKLADNRRVDAAVLQLKSKPDSKEALDICCHAKLTDPQVSELVAIADSLSSNPMSKRLIAKLARMGVEKSWPSQFFEDHKAVGALEIWLTHHLRQENTCEVERVLEAHSEARFNVYRAQVFEQLAHGALEKRNRQEALTFAKKAWEFASEDPAVHEIIGMAHYDKREYHAVAEHLECIARQRKPSLAVLRALITSYVMQAENLKADKSVYLALRSKALPHLERYLPLAQTSEDRLWALQLSGKIALSCKEIGKAAEYVKGWLSLTTGEKRGRALAYSARVSRLQGKLKDSIELYRQALEVSPNIATENFYREDMLQDTKRLPLAVLQIGEQLRKTPQANLLQLGVRSIIDAKVTDAKKLPWLNSLATMIDGIPAYQYGDGCTAFALLRDVFVPLSTDKILGAAILYFAQTLVFLSNQAQRDGISLSQHLQIWSEFLDMLDRQAFKFGDLHGKSIFLIADQILRNKLVATGRESSSLKPVGNAAVDKIYTAALGWKACGLTQISQRLLAELADRSMVKDSKLLLRDNERGVELARFYFDVTIEAYVEMKKVLQHSIRNPKLEEMFTHLQLQVANTVSLILDKHFGNKIAALNEDQKQNYQNRYLHPDGTPYLTTIIQVALLPASNIPTIVEIERLLKLTQVLLDISDKEWRFPYSLLLYYFWLLDSSGQKGEAFTEQLRGKFWEICEALTAQEPSAAKLQIRDNLVSHALWQVSQTLYALDLVHLPLYLDQAVSVLTFCRKNFPQVTEDQEFLQLIDKFGVEGARLKAQKKGFHLRAVPFSRYHETRPFNLDFLKALHSRLKASLKFPEKDTTLWGLGKLISQLETSASQGHAIKPKLRKKQTKGQKAREVQAR